MAYTQFFSLNSFNDYSEIKDQTDKHFAISMIALKKYSELEYYFKNKLDITFTEMVCLLISKYNTNKAEYYRYYSNMEDVLKDDERLDALIIINKYLTQNDKKQLKKINKGIQKN